jgi:mRNA-degrading endonuclease HigB of HigAB toxin-antitoxin module
MRIISKRNLLAAQSAYGDAEQAVKDWQTIIARNQWGSVDEIRKGYSNSVDEVYGYTISILR